MSKSIDIKYSNKWTGYKNYKNVTSLLPTDLAAGSKNIFIQDGSQLETRGGSSYLGAAGTVGVNTNAAWTLAHRIHSDYDQFVNNQGTVMPFRVYYSGTTARGDVLECWLPEFVAGVPQTTKKWYQVNATAPVTAINSTHKWYWAEWYDPLNVQNRIVFTYGTNLIGSYSGGYAPVTAVGAGTITTNGTWRSKGFIEAPEGVNSVVINGVTYALSAGDFSTNTITVASTAGVSVNNVAFQALNSDSTTFGIADVCSSINNQVYYIDWTQRNVFLSWNRNRASYLGDTIYIGTSGLDDAVFAGTFSGTTTDTYLVNIDSVVSPSPTFVGSGTNGLIFNTSGYTQIGITNKYKVVVNLVVNTLALSGSENNSVQYDVSSATGSFVQGEVITGGTSGNTETVIWDDQKGSLLHDFKPVATSMQPGELITGGTSGNTALVLSDRVDPNSYRLFNYIVYKNDVQVSFGSLINVAGFPDPSPYTVFDGITFSFDPVLVGNLTPDPTSFGQIANFIFYDGVVKSGDSWEITVTAPVDTFSWSLNGESQGSLIPITGGVQSLSQGVTVNFVQTTGHKVADSWRMVAYPTVQKGWRDFYYTQPTRLPGEGFKLQLESNGWTMKPQETEMYINGQAGEYYRIEDTLSSDLKSETIRAIRLKSEPQKKALYPYLMSYNNNYMSIVSQEKTWDILGRQKFLELPQVKSLSDTVKYDFYPADWEDANIRYMKRKQFFTIPREGKILVWDDFMKYWHTPQEFARRISSIGFIDGEIVGHSYERNETYTIFDGTRNDLEIYPLETSIVSSYWDYGRRFSHKETDAIAIDGFIEGAPEINWRVNFGVGGCNGIENGVIDPAICFPADTASLGKSSLGFHGLGNSPTDVIPHFTYGKTFNNEYYYLRNIELSCNSMDQRWSITNLGNSAAADTVVNADIFNTENPY